jgi:(p)ppGpp synthase/HD superfamily hydrolase
VSELKYKELALKIAKSAHKGQCDKGGVPYINHPLKVASAFEDETRYVIALLHDVAEDSDVTVSDLIDRGFPPEITDALTAITRCGESDEDYYKKVKSNTLAAQVKIEDLKHNIDLSRIPNPTQQDYERTEKYEQAKRFLEA